MTSVWIHTCGAFSIFLTFLFSFEEKSWRQMNLNWLRPFSYTSNYWLLFFPHGGKSRRRFKRKLRFWFYSAIKRRSEHGANSKLSQYFMLRIWDLGTSGHLPLSPYGVLLLNPKNLLMANKCTKFVCGYTFVCVSVCVCVFVPVCVHLCDECVRARVWYVCVCMHAHMCVSMCVYVLVCLSVCLSVCITAW